ncbi:hypothetical protein CJ203_07585 [Corynebacterium tuscaniense]|uniref:Lipoprotein LpqB n=1 Tax=Corynebacterium tuscaniense TaxID=302449 RepID=A0A2N6T464_9CORY|nr:LpqB family beta-propeller domain-containing protein [Corynebacterium tuscaniense]PMC64097.1 hypothetical protein CJ203_07585 [Corynebacterium tuscaniense]
MRGLNVRTTCVAVAAVPVLFFATGCATLPTSTEPHALGTFEQRPDTVLDQAPPDGMEPDLLLREFFAASANPTGNFEVARKYLTQEMGKEWKPSESTIVLDTFEMTSSATVEPNKRAYVVTGRIIGTLQPGGAFTPAHRGYEATMELTPENGQWRVSNLPNDVVVDRTDLRNHYEPRNLYFYDSTGQRLVADRRWVFSRTNSIGSTLLAMLVSGPSERLAPSLINTLPEDSPDLAYAGMKDGVYQFTGLAGVDEQSRARFAAQIAWTLQGAGEVGPYAVSADGTGLIGDSFDISTDDFEDLNPVPAAEAGPDLYTLSNGKVSAVTDLESVAPTKVEQIAGLNSLGNISQIDIGDDGLYAAAVNVDDQHQSLVVGRVGGNSHEVLRAGSLTRPSLEPDHSGTWVVQDGKRVVRAVRSAATGEVVVNDVALTLPDALTTAQAQDTDGEERDATGEITVLRLSHTGAHVAMVIDGHLVVGVVERREDGKRAIVNTVKYAADLDGSAVSADWQPDGSLLVGTSNRQAPIVRVDQDGFSTTTLPSGNIGGPVVAVGANSSMMYITDSKVIMRMPTSTRDSLNWREVPGLQGVRAAPVLPKP